jgi:hypothetical protein
MVSHQFVELRHLLSGRSVRKPYLNAPDASAPGNSNLPHPLYKLTLEKVRGMYENKKHGFKPAALPHNDLDLYTCIDLLLLKYTVFQSPYQNVERRRMDNRKIN